MFLRQLTLKGFKSFAETTALMLEPGVTVVVGPNGSGKSNVVDAIAWVLGAQAPSSVRSQKMDDVIFAGTARRPALGRAEVSLTIDNSAGLLPIELTEVTLTRTLWRSGESEYAINGAPCRLLDVQELLSDSGVGRQQHVIVGQGQIDAVLNARPEDRRSIVEEAAGVLKYRKRKEKAERRLDATEGNLLRVQDLLREVRRQLRPLERQADAARRHGEVVSELSAFRVHLAGREIASLRKRQQTLTVERRGIREEQGGVRTELARLDAAVLASEAQLGASGAPDVGDALMRVEQLRERARGLAAVLVERRRGLERERVQAMDASVAANLEADAARLRSELADVVQARAMLDPELAALAEEEAALASWSSPDGTEGPADLHPARAMSAAAEVRGELRTRRAALQLHREERSHIDASLETLVGRERHLDDELRQLKTSLAEGEAMGAPLVEQLEAVEARRVAAEASLELVTTAHRDATARRGAAAARVDALTLALDQARAKAGADQLAEVAGVVGTLVDLVEIDDGWEAAFEAAAGEALAAVVVADAEAGRRALRHLHGAGSRGGVLPAGLIPDRGPRSPLVPATAAEHVRSHVHARDKLVSALLDHLLDHAIAVAGGWQEAVDAALAQPGAVVVTKDGDRFSTAGWRLGSAGAGVTAAALDDARDRSATIDSEVTRLAETARAARADLESARAAEAGATSRLDAHHTASAALADAVARAQAERRLAGQATESARSARAVTHERHEREAARITELAAVLAGLEADEAHEAEAARQQAEARSRLEAEARRLALRRRDLAVRVAGLDERQTFVEQRLGELERRLRESAAGGGAQLERVQRTERSAVAVERLGLLVAGHRQVVEARLAHLQEERRRQTDDARAASARLDQLRRDRIGAERVLAELTERERRLEIEDAEGRMRLEAAVEGLRRELDTEPDVAVAAELPPLPDGTSAAARVRELEREIRLMGPINPLALEEFNALQGRHRFLEEQLEDVRSTRRELHRVIRSVDAEIQAVFAAAFADVSENFTSLFATLFPGGSGRLLLTVPDDLLSTGIEVEAKPSGKNVKKLSLLSGGERSLTALAFLFAVFRSRPSPFYVMDEVEAALDDVNLRRFLGLVGEFRGEAQLVVVSHQKRTMEAADCLIGVTMQSAGSSKVVMERVAAGAS